MSPPASVSGSNASFASDHDESQYLLRVRRLHRSRLGLATTIAAIAIVAVACEAHSLQYFYDTRKFADLWLYLWPEQLDKRPTVASITCGVLIFSLATAYIVAALLPSPRARTILLNYFSSAASVCGFITACTAIGISLAFNNPHQSDGLVLGETIRSWSCTWSSTYVDYEFPDRMVPSETIDSVSSFRGLCMETRASWTLMVLLIVFEFAFCVVAGAGWWLEAKMEKKRSAAATAGGDGSVTGESGLESKGSPNLA